MRNVGLLSVLVTVLLAACTGQASTTPNPADFHELLCRDALDRRADVLAGLADRPSSSQHAFLTGQLPTAEADVLAQCYEAAGIPTPTPGTADFFAVMDRLAGQVIREGGGSDRLREIADQIDASKLLTATDVLADLTGTPAPTPTP